MLLHVVPQYKVGENKEIKFKRKTTKMCLLAKYISYCKLLFNCNKAAFVNSMRGICVYYLAKHNQGNLHIYGINDHFIMPQCVMSGGHHHISLAPNKLARNSCKNSFSKYFEVLLKF